jgi:hypothetical protein
MGWLRPDGFKVMVKRCLLMNGGQYDYVYGKKKPGRIEKSTNTPPGISIS